ncbi:hypothetical protein HID58_052128 [Brassica napus]|uniref:Uncharacterized protein n=1 Tax=Brassica napus TaxID=3708 RepID=A0ABQ8AAY0_BRANA|nr:hypothetical protein HID58_052128 [Brassica napus]
MTKFPNTYEESLCDSKAAVVLTVWRKSLLFNCDGFTVYNSNGNLVFRVDNYMNSPKDNIKLSLGDCWAVYDGETQRDPIFTAKKNVSILTNKRSLAWVSAKKTILYEVEGSYGQKSCKIVDVRNKKKTAEIKRKDAMVGGGSFGKDVFKLIVESDMEPRVAMALTIILDQIKMTKVHPKFPNTYEESLCDSKAAVVLTVWRKSLLFNCDGFTVYNSNGNLVFRVDNYMNSTRDNIKLSMGDCWAVYDGETQRDPIFTAKKNVSILTNKRSLAWVSAKKTILYEVEGSYGQRSCKIVDVRRNKRKTAEIKRKDAMVGGGSFGKDVFKLIVEPEMEPRVAMALTIILDKMFRSY